MKQEVQGEITGVLINDEVGVWTHSVGFTHFLLRSLPGGDIA